MHRALIIIIQELYGNANQNSNKSYTTDSSRAHSSHYKFSHFYIDKVMCGIQFLLYKDLEGVFLQLRACSTDLQVTGDYNGRDRTGLHSWKVPGSSKDDNCTTLLMVTILQQYSDKTHWRTSITIHWMLLVCINSNITKKLHPCQGNGHYDCNLYNCSLKYI